MNLLLWWKYDGYIHHIFLIPYWIIKWIGKSSPLFYTLHLWATLLSLNFDSKNICYFYYVPGIVVYRFSGHRCYHENCNLDNSYTLNNEPIFFCTNFKNPIKFSKGPLFSNIPVKFIILDWNTEKMMKHEFVRNL